MLPMWMQDEMILFKIYAPLGATALNIVYYSQIGQPQDLHFQKQKGHSFWKSDQRLFSLLQKETVWQFFVVVVMMARTPFFSTNDPLLIHFLCPFIIIFINVIKQPCPCVGLTAPSQNIHFRRGWRPLVEERIPNIACDYKIVKRKRGLVFFFFKISNKITITRKIQNTHFRLSLRPLVEERFPICGL